MVLSCKQRISQRRLLVPTGLASKLPKNIFHNEMRSDGFRKENLFLDRRS